MKMRWRERIKGNRKHRFPYFFGSPHVPFAEPFGIFDDFPIYQLRRNLKPVIALGHEKNFQFITRKLHHPNHLKRALYYQELIDGEHVESKADLARRAGISRTQTRLILRMGELDKEIKDFILKMDDSDPRLDFLSVYRLQPLLQLKSKGRQRRKFWQMIEEQYPGQSACYMIWGKANS